MRNYLRGPCHGRRIDLSEEKFPDADGIHFLTMELVEGQSLDTVLPEGGLDALTAPATVTIQTDLKAHFGFRVSPDNSHESFTDLNRNSEVFTREHGAPVWQPVLVNGKPSRARQAVDWLDNDRALFWDSARKQTVLWNAATGEAKNMAGIEGPATFGFAAQGQQAIVNQSAEKSDIWLLTLEK